MSVSRLYKRFALLLFAVFATCAAVFLIPPDPHSYLATITDKHRLLEKANSPKVILVGGSNLAFSVDSRRLAEELGREVVNMGLQAGIGLNYMMREVEADLGRGDIVVLVPEYQHFYTTLYGEGELISVLRLYPPAWRHILTPGQFRSALLWFPSYARSRVIDLARAVTGSRPLDPVYRRGRFNALGDVELPLQRAPSDPAKLRLFVGRPQDYSVDRETIGRINRFAAEARRRGAQVFVMYPSVPDIHYHAWRQTVDQVHRELRRRGNVRILDTPADAVLPGKDFFDTAYHLNGEGRERRTTYIAGVLGRVIGYSREGRDSLQPPSEKAAE